MWGRVLNRRANIALEAAVSTSLAHYICVSWCEAPQDSPSPLSNVYTRKDVASRNGNHPSGKMWVTYKGGVYDITEFVESHPGGMNKIKLASGKDLEPFWRLYGVHKQKEVLEILEELRIGRLSAEEAAATSLPVADDDDPYKNDPERHPAFIINSAKPFNAEPPGELLHDAGFITPSDIFYVRNHLPVPVIDPVSYRLEVEVENGSKDSIFLTIDDLKTKFPRHTVVCATQCAGNRRTDMNSIKTVKGLNWDHMAISNSEWTGVKLRDVLAYAGLKLENNDDAARHVQFEGIDKDMVTNYGSSIPIHTALDPTGDVILAFEMNGEPIPRDHGFPIRAIVPGVVGARNVKWLSKVKACKDESPNHWQQNDYKGFSPNVDFSNVDWNSAPAIQDMPVVSVFQYPAPGSVVISSEKIEAKGYAWAGGGRGIIRVDISADNGATWHTATLQPTNQPLHRTWAWTLWEVEIPVPQLPSEATTSNGRKTIELVCRAVDSSYNTQPEKPIWNMRGVISNGWHRVPLEVEDDH
eukprot:534727_1